MRLSTVSRRAYMAAAMVFFIGTVARCQSRPNILFLLADDQAVDTIAALGNAEVHTPNLDRLAREGMTFTRAYNQGGWHGAICVASRTMLVTGRFLWHARQDERLLADYIAGERLWPQLLEEVGYRTYFTGKWHVQAEATQAFQTVRHVRPGMPQDTPTSYNRPPEGGTDPWSPSDTSLGGFWEGGRHWSEVVADDVVDYLAESAAGRAPFFIYAAFNAPHDPRQSPQEYVDRYPHERIQVPKDFLREYPHNEAMQSGRGLRDERLAPFPRTEHAVRVHRAEYYALVTHLDAQIGRILEALEQSGQLENTVIFYTADHGLAVGHHGLFGKQNMFDHSVRVPLFVVGPNIPRGVQIEAPVYLQDIMPTVCEFAGREVPAHVEFRSLLPLMRGDRDENYDAIYGAYVDDGQRMITEWPWKLILYPRARVALLFHLEDDPHEMHDVSDMTENLPIMRRLFRRLQKLQAETGDVLELDGIYSKYSGD